MGTDTRLLLTPCATRQLQQLNTVCVVMTRAVLTGVFSMLLVLNSLPYDKALQAGILPTAPYWPRGPVLTARGSHCVLQGHTMGHMRQCPKHTCCPQCRRQTRSDATLPNETSSHRWMAAQAVLQVEAEGKSVINHMHTLLCTRGQAHFRSITAAASWAASIR